jgi:TPR repeat protein
VIIETDTGAEVADFTHWLGDIDEVRELSPGRFVARDAKENALFWDVARSGRELARANLFVGRKPLRPTGVCALGHDQAVVRNSSTYGDHELEVWSLRGDTLPSRLTTHVPGRSRPDHQSGLGALGPLAVTWGRDATVRISEGEEIAELRAGTLSSIDYCTVLHEDGDYRSTILCVGPEGVRAVFPQQNVTVVLRSPGDLEDGGVRRVVRVGPRVYAWTRTALWRLALERGDGEFVPVLRLDDLIVDGAGWTIFPNRLSRVLRRFEATHGALLASLITADLAQAMARDEPESAMRMMFQDVSDDTYLDLHDACIADVGGGRFLATVSLSRASEREPSRALLAIAFDDGAILAAASIPGAEPALPVREGVVVEIDDSSLLLGCDASGALTLGPLPPRLTLNAPVRHDDFPIVPRADCELILTIPHQPLPILVTLGFDRLSATIGGQTETWFAPAGYRLFDVDGERLRLSVVTTAGDFQVLDLGDADAPQPWQIRLARAELLRSLGRPDLAGRAVEEALHGEGAGRATEPVERTRWAIEMAEALVCGGHLVQAAQLVPQVAELLRSDRPEFSGSVRTELFGRLQRVAFKGTLVAGGAELGALFRTIAAMPRSDSRATVEQLLVGAALDLCRAGAPWFRHLEELRDFLEREHPVANRTERTDRALRVLSYVIDLVTIKADVAPTGAFVPAPVPAVLAGVLERALAGDADACNSIGTVFGQGELVRRSPRDAAHWYQKAIAHGSPLAAFNLSMMHSQGEGIEKDAARAFELMKAAAAGGLPRACCNLGIMYLKGEGCAPDGNEAVRWLTRAHELGDELATVSLAATHAFGEIVPRDVARARELLAGPLRRGNPQALVVLGQIERAEREPGRTS